MARRNVIVDVLNVMAHVLAWLLANSRAITILAQKLKFLVRASLQWNQYEIATDDEIYDLTFFTEQPVGRAILKTE